MLDSISIVVPAFNEEQRLPATLTAILEYLRSHDWRQYEILVVNDGSRDGTARVVSEFAARAPAVFLLENPGNRGKGFSVRHGMLKARHDWVLFTDADLSAPIEELGKLAGAARAANAAVAIGSRAVDRSLIEVHQSVFRETAGRIFNLLMRLSTGLPFHDTQCGFKLFRADAARDVFRRQVIDRWGFDAEALFIARKLGYHIVEVPVRWSHAEGTKIRMLSDSANMFLDLLRVRWYSLRGLYK